MLKIGNSFVLLYQRKSLRLWLISPRMFKSLRNGLTQRNHWPKIVAIAKEGFNAPVSPHLLEKMRSTLPKKRKLQNVKYVMAVASGKGGVGKSTVAVNLAVATASCQKLRVGLLDADLYGPSVPLMMNLGKNGNEDFVSMTEDNTFFIPPMNYGVSCMSIGLFTKGKKSAVVWRGLMVAKALEQLIFQTKWGDLDILIIDMPPGTGDTQLTITQLIDLSGALIVSTPQDVALIDAQKGIQMFGEVKVPILGVVENMSGFICPHCHYSTPIFKTSTHTWLSENHPNIDLLAKIPLDPRICSGSDEGHPVVLSLPPDDRIRLEFEQLADNLLKRLPIRS
jgi:ATP-binding protein involved in chromosome partitioning